MGLVGEADGGRGCVAGKCGGGCLCGEGEWLWEVSVCSPWALPCTHVRLDHVDSALPFCSVVSLEQDVRVRILFDGPHLNPYAYSLTGL